MTAEPGRAKLKVKRFGCGWPPPLLIAKECRVIQLLPCPDCQQLTLFPEGVTLEAIIECPHCHAQFVVGEMLTDRFGSWLVVDDPGYSEDSEPLELQAAEAAPPKPKTDWSKFEPITHEQFERMRRKSSSPIWSLVQIVLGGVAAIPISLLLIWHVIGADVAGAGPLVGRYAPWLVPEKFRPFAARTDEARPAPASRNQVPPAAGASGFRRFDDVLGADANKEPTHTIAPNDLAQAYAKKLPQRAARPQELSDAPVVPAEPSAEDDAQAESVSNNVFSVIQKTIRDLESWEVAVRDESANLKELALPLYRGFVDIAAAIDAQPTGNPVLRVVKDKMDAVGKTVRDQTAAKRVIQQGAGYWIKQQSNNLPFSLAMIVEVESLEENQQVWRLTTPAAQRLSVGGMPLVIEVPSPLRSGLTSGKQYLLLGTVTAAKRGAGENQRDKVPPPPELDAGERSAETDRSLPEDAGAPEAAHFMANYVYAL